MGANRYSCGISLGAIRAALMAKSSHNMAIFLQFLASLVIVLGVVITVMQAGQWGFQYYRPPPHKTAIYRPIFNFSTVPFSPVKFFANTIETDNLENFLCTLYRD